jgi:hypothetical protein
MVWHSYRSQMETRVPKLYSPCFLADAGALGQLRDGQIVARTLLDRPTTEPPELTRQ